MPIKEIASVEDARNRLTLHFLPWHWTAKEKLNRSQAFLEQNINRYAHLACFLSDKPLFEKYLEVASAEIWEHYNRKEIATLPNRYTAAIASVGRQYGLSGQNNFVLIDEASKLFGELLRNGHLWKDSFAPGHGEFAHSYQWIAFAIYSNRTSIADLYANTAMMSFRPMFVKAKTAGIELRRVFLWEWLVDCTRYDDDFQRDAHRATEAYKVDGALRDAWSSTTDSYSREINIELVEEDFEEANVFCKDRYRNANNITDFVKRQPADYWFITAYEKRRELKRSRQEEEQRVLSVHRLLQKKYPDTHYPPPTQEQIRDLRTLKPSQIAGTISGSSLTKQPNPGKNFQMIDIGKDLLRHKYTSRSSGTARTEEGGAVPVRFDRNPLDSIPLINAKKQEPRKFHGIPGTYNAEL